MHTWKSEVAFEHFSWRVVPWQYFSKMKKPNLEKNLDFFFQESNITPRAEFTELNTCPLLCVNLPLCGRRWSDCASLSSPELRRPEQKICLTNCLTPEPETHIFWIERWVNGKTERKMDKALPSGGHLNIRRGGEISPAKVRMRQGGGPSMCKGPGD